MAKHSKDEPRNSGTPSKETPPTNSAPEAAGKAPADKHAPRHATAANASGDRGTSSSGKSSRDPRPDGKFSSEKEAVPGQHGAETAAERAAAGPGKASASSSGKGGKKSGRKKKLRRKRMFRRIALICLLTVLIALLAWLVLRNHADRSAVRVPATPVPTPAVSTSPTAALTPVPTATPTAAPTPVPTPTPTPTPEPEPVSIVITATGDVTLGTYITPEGRVSNFKAAVEEKGYDYFLENYRDYFSQDDLTIVNLEGPLSKHSDPRPGRFFNFRGYPDYVNILSGSSVEVCNLGNNHALDFKEAGFKDTCNALEKAGIGASGYGPEYYTEVKGVKVGFVGYTEWNFEEKQILKKVKAAKKKCDLLIVSMHWGEEGHDVFTAYSSRMGRALVDAGADLVIGNHPHVPGAIMKYKGKYIIHTLGNFVFGGNDQPGRKVRRSAVFRQKFIVHPDGTVEDGGIDLVPGWISGKIQYNTFRPIIAKTKDGKSILGDIVNASKGKFKLKKVLWLEDSYVYQHGILERPNPTAEPTEASAGSPEASASPGSASTEEAETGGSAAGAASAASDADTGQSEVAPGEV